jgi:uncharacterized membrane protein
MELGRFMGYLHPILIHFPIVLLLIAVLLEGIAFFHPDPRLRWAGKLLLLLGAVSTLFAFVCGNFAELWAARSGISQEALEYHELLATITSWLFVGLTGWRLLMRDETGRVWRGVWLLVGVVGCILLIVTGHHGAGLVYEHGAAVHNVGLQRIPTHEDLSTLLQQQDPESIFYSNMMHHIFGWMVLLLSGLLLLDQIAPGAAKKARRFGPLLLFAGGVFLLIFSDQDAWPLYQVRPFRPLFDKEVLLHKTYAVLMLLLGARGLWQTLKRRMAQESGGESNYWRVQDRLMAVFALVGGALLFTHVHSAAPYANVAVGVYVHHTAMGLTALLIGAVKLLDDRAARSARWRSMAYPALMCAEAILLINYNEGLPWFLGYGRHSTTPVHGGLVAPLGSNRAEMLYDPVTGRLDLFILHPDSAAPKPIPAQEARLVIRLGNESTEVALLPEPGSGSDNDHFSGTARFLHGQPLFQAQATVTADGRDCTADFEPWVDKVQASLVHAAFECPMHPQIGSAVAARCSVCGMALQPHRAARPSGELHDAAYTMIFRFTPEQPLPGTPVGLSFTPMDIRTHALAGLDVVHTKKIHLIIVKKDLSTFDHVHPEEEPPGRYSLSYIFKEPGSYLLFADVTPTGGGNQVFPVSVTVGGHASPSLPLRVTEAGARLIGDYRVALTLSPYPAPSKDEVTLTFALSESGKPVTDLQPYLGAGGHCVILSEDGKDYLHSHPLEPDGATLTGPQVNFHTRFPRPGLYKIWGQFKHRGKVLTADFVVRIS